MKRLYFGSFHFFPPSVNTRFAMKRFFLLSVMLLFCSFSLGAQDCYRFSFLQMQKKSSADKNFRVYEMSLDFDGKTSFFYSETSYKRDSLNVIAFDRSGEIANEEAYGERIRLAPTTNDKSIIDFSNSTMRQFYNPMAFFEGNMPLELPQWVETDEEEDQSGYHCKLAKGTYLGREWTIWFTEEIPVNIGPWFLWGAPGLIVYAKDSEDVLQFRLLGVEKVERSRVDNYLSYMGIRESRPSAKVYSMPMKEMETMHTRYMRDVTYYNKIHGVVDSYRLDRNGNRIEEPMTKPYIPYIADGYWKDK